MPIFMRTSFISSHQNLLDIHPRNKRMIHHTLDTKMLASFSTVGFDIRTSVLRTTPSTRAASAIVAATSAILID